jgi:hypothetical protein
VSNSKNQVSLREESVANEGSFAEVYEALNEDPASIKTTLFKIKTSSLSIQDNRDSLPEILSFPDMMYGEEHPNVVNMSYGEANSTVEYFDFNGGVQVLANMLGAVAVQESLENTYEHLNTKSLGITIAPMLEYILNDTIFINKLKEDESVDGEQLVQDLENLIEQMSPASEIPKSDNVPSQTLKTGTSISPEFFQNIGFIETYVQEHYIDNSTDEDADLRVNKYGHDYTALEIFLRAIAKNEGRKTLFDITETSNNGRSVTINNLNEVTEQEEKLDVSRSFIYTLKGSNAFDEYAKSKESMGSLNPNNALLLLDTYHAQERFNWEVKIKSLGIPEMDTLAEISSPRVINFTVHDLSKEKNALSKGDPTNVHWLSGLYQPLAINHRINNSGYKTEFKLFKNMRIA